MADLEITVLAGAFAGMKGRVVSVDGDQVEVEIRVFGRATLVRLERAQLDGLGLPDLDEALAAQLARVRDDEDRAWWLARVADGPAVEEWSAFCAWREAQDATRDLDALGAALAAQSFTHAAEVHAWLARELPRTRPEHPLVVAARAEGRVTASGSPKLSDDQWEVVHAFTRAGSDRRFAARLAAALAAAGQPDPATLERQRRAALERGFALAPKVRARYLDSHGLWIPDHAFRCWAFFEALTALEREAIEYVGVSLGAIYERFEADPSPREGLDHRLNGRFYQAPAELLHALWGDSDGLHWGLWYDTGEEREPAVAGFYARDGGGGFFTSATLLGAVRDRVAGLRESLAYASGEEAERIEIYAEVLDAALHWFEPDVAPLERSPSAETVDDFGVMLPEDAGPIPDHGEVYARWDRVRDDWELVQGWAALARDELRRGQPARALILGRDLHWLSVRDEAREALAAELLVAAYRALGREALAGIAEAHANEGRRLSSVGVYP